MPIPDRRSIHWAPTANEIPMRILQQFFQNVFQQAPVYQDPAAPQQIRPGHEELELLLSIDSYGDFQLSDAVRPSFNANIQPSQGYRHDVYVDEESGREIPVIMAAASRDILFQLFMQLIHRLGPSVDVVLESSHEHSSSGHTDFYREQIDAPVLTSALWDYEQLLTHDGCTGIAVLNPETPQEIQFDEHKLLIIYGSPLEPFEYLLESHGLPCRSDMQFITEAEHIHTSSQDYLERFNQLRTQLGIDAEFGNTNMC